MKQIKVPDADYVPRVSTFLSYHLIELSRPLGGHAEGQSGKTSAVTAAWIIFVVAVFRPP
jgi:hypothetical protein